MYLYHVGGAILAGVEVVKELIDLESSFSEMLFKVVHFLKLNCDLSEAQLYLNTITGTENFSECDNFEGLVMLLRRDHIDIFNISCLQGLVVYFDKDKLTELVKLYEEKRLQFFKNAIVRKFQHAIVNKVKPDLHIGKNPLVNIKIPHMFASHLTLRDMSELAREAFEDCHKSIVRIHVTPG